MYRFFRFSTGLFISLVFAALPAFAQSGGKQERIRFADGKSETCVVVSADEKGVTLRLDRIPKPVAFEWWQLDTADAARLRDRLVDPPVPPKEGEPSVDGFRITTHDGDVYDGIKISGAPEGEVWLKNARGTAVIKAGKIALEKKIRISLRRAYRPEEVLRILVEGDGPKTPEAMDRLGADLLRAQLRDRALTAFKLGEFLRHPDWPEAALYRELSHLRSRVRNLEVRRSVFQAQERYLAGDYDAALQAVEAVDGAPAAAQLPAPLRAELRRLRAQLQAFRGRARNARIVDEWHRTLEVLLKSKAMDRSVAFADARIYAERGVLSEVETAVRTRLNFSPDDPAVRLAWDKRPERIEKHSYGDSSWIVLRPDAGDPAGWWANAADAERYNLLKGFYVDKNRTRIREAAKECSTCGGTGLLQTKEVCGSCRGVKSHRVILYR